MSIDIEWLSRLARGASRGPWTRSKAGHIFAANDKVAECPPCQGHRGERNAKFIAAADPAAILTLIERLQEAEAREQALAAHVERLFETFNSIAIEGESGMYSPRELEDALCDIFSDTPTTSLARLKAEKQAEALERFADDWPWDELRPDHKNIRHYAQRVRRQAEQADTAGEA